MENQDYFDWTGGLFSKADIFGKPEALKGVRVLELCTRVFGPMTADLLGDFGAEVIKIELPGVGDLMRYVAPRGFFWQNMSPAFAHMNHNKYHVGIDIRKPEGGELLRRLVLRSDILVENFRARHHGQMGGGIPGAKGSEPGVDIPGKQRLWPMEQPEGQAFLRRYIPGHERLFGDHRISGKSPS